MFKTAAIVLATAALAMAQNLQINSPASMLTCQPVLLSWSGGSAPYFLNILPGGQVSGTPIKQFGQISANSLTYTVDIAAGTSITLAITDSTGVNAYSSPITIQAGSSTACINNAVSVTTNTAPGSSIAAVSSSVAAAASSAASSSSAVVASASSAIVAASSSIAAAASSAVAPRPSSGAEKLVAGVGSVIVGAVALAVFA